MTAPSTLQLFAASVSFLPAIVWAIMAQNAWRFVRTRRPHARLFRLVPPMATGATLFYSLAGVICLLPFEWRPIESGGNPGPFEIVFVANDWAMIVTLALAHHITRLMLTDRERPGPRWLAANYGCAALLGSLSVSFPRVIPAPTFQAKGIIYLVILQLYSVVMIGLLLGKVIRVVRRGDWWPAGPALVARRADVVMLAGGLVGIGIFLVTLLLPGGARELSTGRILLMVLVSWSFAVPLAVRILREVVRGVLVSLGMVAAMATTYFLARPLVASVATAEGRGLADLAVFGSLLLIAVPGQAWLRRAVDHIVFRAPRRQRAELQAFLLRLSPELGALECCRRALGELVRVRQLRGAAIVLQDGESVAAGALALDPLLRLWPRGAAADALPRRALISNEFLDLPPILREALVDADVVAVVPIATPRRRSGDLFMRASPLGGSFDDEEVEMVEAFADQLALVLDGTELLARTVAVERSLAHAQKLAAIGELAARIAHDIRNPVTAARSLAQQLASEPGAPFGEELGVILGELDRVERQVADLLRFARRDELRMEPVDLGALARATLEQLGPRLEAAGVGVRVDAAAGVTATVDRERLRHVLVNLIENAIEALAETHGIRRLALEVGTENGSATLRVSDNGPGIPPEAFSHLFEPFFSLKANGTGLGLAIARRTIEAHGGRIAAEVPAGPGLAFRIELPLGGRSEADA